MADETSQSTGSSSSSSVSTPVQTPQSEFLLGLGQMAQQMSQALYTWGQQVFANTSQVTDANINRFIDTSQQAGGLAANAISRYENLFQPQENQLIKDANTYASPDRIAMQMGASESGVGQSMDASRQNYERQLQAYGIDPSSGRYAELERVANSQEGAAKAAAGTAAELNTEQIGRNLRSQAIQVGQQYPAAAVNELNSAQQGIAGAQNAVLANANTGAALMGPALAAIQAGMGVKLPNMGTASGSRQQQQASAHKPTPEQKDPNANQNQNQNPVIPPQPKAPGNTQSTPASTKGLPIDPGSQDFSQGYSSDFDQTAPAPFDQQNFDTQYQNMLDQFGTDANGAQLYGQDQYNEQGLDASTPPPEYTDQYDQSNNYGAADYSGYEGDSGYAAGGEVGGQTTGGAIPTEASPSGGAQTDDVNAHLNAEEFVIPKDTARWKGEEFFHNLIAKSREARVKAMQTVGGKPSQRPSNGPPSFVSRQMGA